MVFQEAINAALQVAIALLITLVGYALAGKKRGSYFRFIGLFPAPPGAVRTTLLAAAILVPASIAVIYLTPLHDAASAGNTVAGKIRELGPTWETAGLIALIAIFKTSLAEEILFRGLIAKTLIRWFGFFIGNSLQALIFGAVHALIFVAPGGLAFDPMLALGVVGLPAVGAFVMVWINERRAGGSIIPGWIIHALSNLIGYPILAFA